MVKKYKSSIDIILLSTVIVLCVLGITMIFSSSTVILTKDKFLFFKKQVLFMFLGLLLMLILSKIKIQLLFKLRYFFIFLSFIFLALTLFSPLAVKAGGSSRWLKLGPFTFQPLEFVKFSLLIYLAYFYDGFKQDKIEKFSIGIIPPFLITCFLGLFLILQPDFGGAAFILVIFFCLSFIGGIPLRYFLVVLGLGMVSLVVGIILEPYRLERVKAFLNPFEDPFDSGYQLVQSLSGLINGGIWGVGLGESKQKFFYLPEAHNDFILSILGEELGFIGLSLVFILILLLLWRWLVIFLKQDAYENKLLAFGAGFTLLWNMYLNLGVVLGVLPPKGVPMPFISYGGSNLLLSFGLVGILLNLSKRVRN